MSIVNVLLSFKRAIQVHSAFRRQTVCFSTKMLSQSLFYLGFRLPLLRINALYHFCVMHKTSFRIQHTS